MQGLAFGARGARLAATSVDGGLRTWDLPSGRRVGSFAGFRPNAVAWLNDGQRVAAIGTDGRLRIVDVESARMVEHAVLDGGAERILVLPDGDIVALGLRGVARLPAQGKAAVASFDSKGTSGSVQILVSPDASQLAAVTGRSVHVFDLPMLRPAGSRRHQVADPTAAIWDQRGMCIAGGQGQLRPIGQRPGWGPVVQLCAADDVRVAFHGNIAALWRGERRERIVDVGAVPSLCSVDRTGRILAFLPRDGGPVRVVDLDRGAVLFDGHADTQGAVRIDVAPNRVAVLRRGGGVRWWDLANNLEFELGWPVGFSLSGSGAWLAGITPAGGVRILDAASGREATLAPSVPSGFRLAHVGFVSRNPALVGIDESGLLLHWDFEESTRNGLPARPRELVQLSGIVVERVGGLTSGSHVWVRFREGRGNGVVFVTTPTGQVSHELRGIPDPMAIDGDHGPVVVPGPGAAIVDLSPSGDALLVRRSVAGQGWFTFDEDGIRVQGN